MRNFCFILITICALTLPLSAQMFEFSPRDAVKLASRSLVVVVLEEDPSVLKRFKKSPEKSANYKALISYSNAALKKSVDAFWKSENPILYKTKTECEALSNTTEEYFTIDFASLWQKDNVQLWRLIPDTSAIYSTRIDLMQRREFGFFELKLIEKYRGSAFYTFQTSSSIPNEYDFATATLFMSALVNNKLEDNKFSTRDYELIIQQANQALASKALWVDSTNVNRQGKSFDYIAEEYDSASVYKLSNAKTIGQKLFEKDSSFVFLNVVPYIDPISRGQSYIGTSGGSLNEYEKIIYYMQLIINPTNGELIYYDKSEESVVINKDWRRFQRYSRERSFKMPQFNNTTTPTQQKQYQQNQY